MTIKEKLMITAGVLIVVVSVLYYITQPEEAGVLPPEVPEETRTLIWSGTHIDRNDYTRFSYYAGDTTLTAIWLENGIENLDDWFVVCPDNLPEMVRGFIYRFMGEIYSVQNAENVLHKEGYAGYSDYLIFKGSIEPITVRGEIRTRAEAPVWSGSHYDKVISVRDDNTIRFEYGIEGFNQFVVENTVLKAGSEYVLSGNLSKTWAFDIEMDEWFWHRRDWGYYVLPITIYSYYSFYPDNVEEL